MCSLYIETGLDTMSGMVVVGKLIAEVGGKPVSTWQGQEDYLWFTSV